MEPHPLCLLCQKIPLVLRHRQALAPPAADSPTEAATAAVTSAPAPACNTSLRAGPCACSRLTHVRLSPSTSSRQHALRTATPPLASVAIAVPPRQIEKAGVRAVHTLKNAQSATNSVVPCYKKKSNRESAMGKQQREQSRTTTLQMLCTCQTAVPEKRSVQRDSPDPPPPRCDLRRQRLHGQLRCGHPVRVAAQSTRLTGRS